MRYRRRLSFGGSRANGRRYGRFGHWVRPPCDIGGFRLAPVQWSGLAPLALYYGSSRDVPSLAGSITVPLELGQSERLRCARCFLPLSPLRVTTGATAMESCHCYESPTAWR